MNRRTCSAVLALAGPGMAWAASSRTPDLPSPKRVATEDAEFTFMPTPNGVLVAAPHGTVDLNTGALAPRVARLLGAGYVVARAEGGAGATRINVNRPTEGARLTCAAERPSARSEAVYRHYAAILGQASPGSALRLYVEIHGNSDAATSARIEVAAQGISEQDARRGKSLYGTLLAQAQALAPKFPALDLAMQPLDKVHFDAACLKTRGIGAQQATRLMHFELPRVARDTSVLDATAALLAGLVKGVDHLK